MAFPQFRSRLASAGAAATLMFGVAACGSSVEAPEQAHPPLRQLYVNPSAGTDEGTGTEAHPFKTIQAALDDAKPGTEINLSKGVYRERLTTKVNGTSAHPIILKGPETGADRSGRYRAVVTDKSRVVNINHDHYVLEGFTIDGQEQLLGTHYPADLQTISDFKRRMQDKITDSRLIYVGSADSTRGVTGTVVRDMFLNGSGGECVRLRNDTRDATITDSVIQYCGMFGKSVGKSKTEFHNGEGVYIGTSPGSSGQPMHSDDAGSGNVIKGNTIHTFGTECLDVKENAHDNVFENNTCTDNTESTSDGGSLVELRGYDNVVRGNRMSGSLGYGVKIRSDKPEYDKGGNVVEHNRISNTSGKPIFIKSDARQGSIGHNAIS